MEKVEIKSGESNFDRLAKEARKASAIEVKALTKRVEQCEERSRILEKNFVKFLLSSDARITNLKEKVRRTRSDGGMRKKSETGFDVKMVDGKKPKVKFSGSFDGDEMKPEEKTTRGQNLDPFENAGSIIKIQGEKRYEVVNTIIAEVESDAHKKMIKEGRVNIRWTGCKVYGGSDVMRCFKCSRYSDRDGVCRRQSCCPKCMEKPTFKACKKEKCQNE